MTTLGGASHNGTSRTGLVIHVSESRSEMGARAASDIAHEVRACLDKQACVRMIFAAAPSQSEMLAALRKEKNIDWSRVTAFHMDEYLELPEDAPQRFGRWLRQVIFDHLPFAAVLNAAPIDIVCCGIGSNGHLAFNDPPADFDDPVTVKIVHLDIQCRQQQVDDQCFATLSQVPTRALTITVPGLLAGHAIFCTVPGVLKTEAVHRTLLEPIHPNCPASALRLHPRCTLYLDSDSAGEIQIE
jgi:glucosamine-6-phosphate deaminase